MKLLLVLPFLAACASFDTDTNRAGRQVVAGDDSRIVYPLAPQAAHPGDRNDWYRVATKAPTHYTWIVLTPAEFATTCNPRGYQQPQLPSMIPGQVTSRPAGGVVACAIPANAAIYAMGQRWMYSEGLVEHEEAHLLGWEHDDLDQMRLSPTR